MWFCCMMILYYYDWLWMNFNLIIYLFMIFYYLKLYDMLLNFFCNCWLLLFNFNVEYKVWIVDVMFDDDYVILYEWVLNIIIEL